MNLPDGIFRFFSSPRLIEAKPKAHTGIAQGTDDCVILIITRHGGAQMPNQNSTYFAKNGVGILNLLVIRANLILI